MLTAVQRASRDELDSLSGLWLYSTTSSSHCSIALLPLTNASGHMRPPKSSRVHRYLSHCHECHDFEPIQYYTRGVVPK